MFCIANYAGGIFLASRKKRRVVGVSERDTFAYIIDAIWEIDIKQWKIFDGNFWAHDGYAWTVHTRT